MAIRALEIRKELDEKRIELQRAEESIQAMQTRRADVETMVREADCDEKQQAAEQAVNDLEKDFDSAKSAAQVLRDSIAELTKELDALEASEPSNEETKTERKIEKMENIEIRNSESYIAAYANYLKTGKTNEIRSLLTESAEDGTVAVPSFVQDIVTHAWERNEILSHAKKSTIAGILRVQFEVSAEDAVWHEEGTEAPTEENLVLGIISLFPTTAKKIVSVSTEVKDLAPRAFVTYVMEEIMTKLTKAAADAGVQAIIDAPAVSNAIKAGAKSIDAGAGIATVAKALSLLSDEATNPCVIINKASFGAMKQAQYEGNFNADPFEGLPVYYSSKLAAVGGDAGSTWMIVGDLNALQYNFPAGSSPKILEDPYTLAGEDMVRYIGTLPTAVDVIAPYQFVRVKNVGSAM